MNNTLRLIISMAICLAAGALGSLFTTPEIDTWYQFLEKPSWNPPSWVFGPVWTVLYILMGIALYIVWKKPTFKKIKRTAIILFTIQLVLNLAWSWIFFNQHQIGWALVDICVLWVFIVLCIFSFSAVYHSAGWLLVPYICWVSFAVILNYTIWQLNGQ